MVKHLPHISIEKYAAYLDGNLPDEEMQEMKAFVDTDADMQAVLEADSNIEADLYLPENDSIPYEMDLQSIELPSLDAGLPFEENSVIEDFFSLEDDRSWEEMSSILNDGANHHGFLDETGDMNGNLDIEDSPLNLAANENEDGDIHDAPYDWSIHDGDYGFWEMGLPPIVTPEDLIDNETTTPSVDDGI